MADRSFKEYIGRRFYDQFFNRMDFKLNPKKTEDNIQTPYMLLMKC